MSPHSGSWKQARREIAQEAKEQLSQSEETWSARTDNQERFNVQCQGNHFSSMEYIIHYSLSSLLTKNLFFLPLFVLYPLSLLNFGP